VVTTESLGYWNMLCSNEFEEFFMKGGHNVCPKKVALGLVRDIQSVREPDYQRRLNRIGVLPASTVCASLFNRGQGPAGSPSPWLHANFAMWRRSFRCSREVYRDRADLPGIGDSSIPADNKIDMITAAKQIHDLVRSLKIDKACVVGHTSFDGRVRLRRAVPC